MAGRNWLDTFGKAKAMNANADLDRGYEAALLIQSLELEYYGDRPIRPDLELSVPSSVQATVLRKFRAAINVCRSSLDKLEYQRGQLSDGQHSALHCQREAADARACRGTV